MLRRLWRRFRREPDETPTQLSIRVLPGPNDSVICDFTLEGKEYALTVILSREGAVRLGYQLLKLAQSYGTPQAGEKGN